MNIMTNLNSHRQERRRRTIRPFHVGCAALALAGGILGGPALARACSLDSRPSVYADGRLALVNKRAPTTRSQLAVWTPFIFDRTYATHQTVTFTENRREVARSLTAAAMRRPWRWRFGDGHTAYGWTVRHAYARPGHWRIHVDAYLARTHQWYSFDQVTVTIRPASSRKG